MATLNQKAQALLNGLENYLPAGTTASLNVHGQAVTVKNAIATLSGYVADVAAKAPAKVAYQAAVQKVKSEEQSVRELVTGLSEALRSLLGKGNPVLSHFGISSGVRKSPAPKTLVEAAGKAEATRVARQTLGKKQKLEVKAPAVAEGPTGTPPKGP